MPAETPKKAGWVLASLILVAAVANLNLIAGARAAFLHGDEWAYAAGIIAVLIGAALVFFKFPRHENEKQLLAEYREESGVGAPAPTETATPLAGGRV